MYPMEQTQTQTDIHTQNKHIQEVLVNKGIIKGRETECGKFKRRRKGTDRLERWKCGNINSCPICRYEHIKETRKKYSYLTNQFQREGGVLYLLTLTIPHHLGLSFNRFYEGFTLSSRRLKNSYTWRYWFKDIIDYVFHFDRYETLINPRNGFHLHLHSVIGGRNNIDTDEVKNRLYDTWVRCSSGVGSGIPSYEQGIDFIETSNGTYPMKLYENTNVPIPQETYSPEDLEKIFLGYNQKDFFHPDFTQDESETLIKKYRSVMENKIYTRLYPDELGRWYWTTNRPLF